MDWVEKAGKAIEPIVEAGVEAAKREARHYVANAPMLDGAGKLAS